MFTGIVEELGEVVSCAETADGARVRIKATTVLQDAALGASIAVNGVCLTVIEIGDDWWDADLSRETLERTDLARLRPGAPVNLERPVKVDDRLGGHIVQGHVDGIGQIRRPVPNLHVGVPEDLMRYVVRKGSVTVDGVSLTVVDVIDDPPERGFTVAVIPHTSEVTTLGTKDVGDTVNLEVDVTVKYVERLLAWKDA